MKFYLGVHETSWLARADIPLFVSHRRLKRRKRMPVATASWALDSGGFSELATYGRWQTEAEDYVDAARRYKAEIGRLDWASPMDWMCEPTMLAKTGFDVDRHQGLTVENVSFLRQHAPDVPWIPVLQGWALNDYLVCVERYALAGIDLSREPIVGVGSVCRRQSTQEIEEIFALLNGAGIACHGFGVKTQGLRRYGQHLVSADSMAWSYNARKNPPLPGCTLPHCQNCWLFAQHWRERLARGLHGLIT